MARQEMKHIPHPQTWLNQGRWMDEVTVDQFDGMDENERVLAEVMEELKQKECARV
jgi:hypothetical protein